jgi:hypothetical protein
MAGVIESQREAMERGCGLIFLGQAVSSELEYR